IYFDEDLRVPLILIAFCDLMMGTAIYVMRFLLRGRLDFRAYVGSVILPEAVCTIIFSIVLYKLFYRINHMLVEKEKKGRHSLWIRD
ncbi:MAG: rod shape-determining protein MreD, partial [Lachnospiraceae bacterium]|nr:rod shape-determining protein MreD [Lachnospiraceae bacterium]